MLKSHRVIVSRHPSAIQFIGEELAKAMNAIHRMDNEHEVCYWERTPTGIHILVGYAHPSTGFVLMCQDGTEEPVWEEIPVISGDAKPEDLRNKTVYGNIPYHLGCHATTVVAVEFNGAPPRGAEYTLEDMKKAGARLARYQVRGPLLAPCSWENV